LNAPVSIRIPATRTRRILLLGGVAVAVGAGVAGAMQMAGDRTSTSPRPVSGRLLAGHPPLVVELPRKPRPHSIEARLAAAQDMLAKTRKPVPAKMLASLVDHDGDVRVAVARAVAAYSRAHPGVTLRALRDLPQDDPIVRFHVGLVEVWAGRLSAAVADLRDVKRLDPYGFYGTRADNLLHPSMVGAYPPYVAGPALGHVTLDRARAQVARKPDVAEGWLRLAVAREAAGQRPAAVAAARRAVELDPTGVSARVALAVLSFDKDNPAASVGALGTMAAQNPANAEIRFHFALVLLWLSRTDDAVAQFQQLLADQPTGTYAAAARQFIRKLPQG
jgi:tetratricopeptide (TPR) repeat protein